MRYSVDNYTAVVGYKKKFYCKYYLKIDFAFAHWVRKQYYYINPVTHGISMSTNCSPVTLIFIVKHGHL